MKNELQILLLNMKKVLFTLIMLCCFSLYTHAQSSSLSSSYQTRKEARKTLKGYKGFVDAGYHFDILKEVLASNMNRFEVSTSHGYQVNNYFYVGGGAMLNYYTDADKLAVPLFANFKANFINKRVTPFADVKCGYTAGDVEGVFSSLAIGVRFSLAKKKAINLQWEFSYQGVKDGDEYYFNIDDYDFYGESDINYIFGSGLKIGFEF